MRNSISQFSMSPASGTSNARHNRHVDHADTMQHFDPEEIYGSDDSHDEDPGMPAAASDESLFLQH